MDTSDHRVQKKNKSRFKDETTGLESKLNKNYKRIPFQKQSNLDFNSTSSKRRKLESSLNKHDKSDCLSSKQVYDTDSDESNESNDDSVDETMNNQDDVNVGENDKDGDEICGGSNDVSEDETVNSQAEDKEELKAVKEELSHMSFEELEQLKEKLGIKVFNQIMHGTTRASQPSAVKSRKAESRKKDFKRANKSRPMEMSSKKTVSRFRNIIPVKKKVSRDPRFDDLSGEFSEEYFQKSYSFLNDVKTREKQKLQKQLRKNGDDETKSKVKTLLNRMTQQEKSEVDKTKKLEQAKEWTRKERELVAQGKKPFFLKKSDKKKLELADKYRELQKSGTLDNYLSKKRKKNSQKQRKKFLN